jgi:hypothetical protein
VIANHLSQPFAADLVHIPRSIDERASACRWRAAGSTERDPAHRYSIPVPANAGSSASGRVAKASDDRSNATGRAPNAKGTRRLDGAVGFRDTAAASLGGSAARSVVDQADAPGAASAPEVGLAADDLLVGLEAAWAQE